MAASFTSRLLRQRFISCLPAATTGSRVRNLGFFYSTGVVVGKEGDEKVTPDPSGAVDGRFANVEMKKGDWICSQCSFVNFARNYRCLKCRSAPAIDASSTGEIKSGDWSCQQCNFMNFSRNIRCLQCKLDRPHSLLKRGDWTCPKCSFQNFGRNAKCLECRTEKSTFDNLIVRRGDWNCPKCQFMNFARNASCRNCQEPLASKRRDWECPSCNFLNFQRNTSCLKCQHDRPKEEIPQSVEKNWKEFKSAMTKSLETPSNKSPSSGDESSDLDSVDDVIDDNIQFQPKRDDRPFDSDDNSDNDVLQHRA